MKPAWVVLLGCVVACGGKSTATTSPGGSKQGSPEKPERVAATEPNLTEAIDKLVATPDGRIKFRQGDGLKATYDEIVAAIGPVAFANEEKRVLVWFVHENPTTCTRIVLHVKGEFTDGMDLSRVQSTIESEAKNFEDCKKSAATAAQQKLAVDIPEPKQYELEKPSRAALDAWRDRNFKALYALTSPEVRKNSPGDVYEQYAALYAPATGKLVAVEEPITVAMKGYARTATGKAKFEKGIVTFNIGFDVVNGKPMISDFNLVLSEDMRMKPNPDDAAKVSRKALDLVLAGKLAKAMELADPELDRIVRKEPKQLDAMQAYVKKLGKAKSIKLASNEECNESRCLVYDIVTAKGTAKARFEMKFVISEWQLHFFNVE